MRRNLEEFKYALESAASFIAPDCTVSILRETERALSEASREFEVSIREELVEYPAETKVEALNHYIDELATIESKAGYLRKEIAWWAVKLYAPEGHNLELEGEKELASYLPQLAPEIPTLLAGLARCCGEQFSERTRAIYQEVVGIMTGRYGGLGRANFAIAEDAAIDSRPVSFEVFFRCTDEVIRGTLSRVVMKLGLLVSEHSAKRQISQLAPYAKWFDPLTNLCQSITETGGFAACDKTLQDFAVQIKQVAYKRQAEVKSGIVGEAQPAAAPPLAGGLPVLQWNKSVADLAELFYRLARAGLIDLAAHRDRSRDPESNLLGLCRHVCQLFQVAPAHRAGAAKNLYACLSKFKPEHLAPGPFDAAALSAVIGRKPNNANTLRLGAMLEGLGVGEEANPHLEVVGYQWTRN